MLAWTDTADRWVAVVAAGVASVVVWSGCSSSTGDPPPPPSGQPVMGAGGAGAVPSGTGSVSSVGAGGSGFMVRGTGGGGLDVPDGACGGIALKAEKIVKIETEIVTETITGIGPAALYLMQDQSGSMADKWGYTYDAITQFANDPNSAGLHVAINYYPLAIFPCIPNPLLGDCTGEAYRDPVADPTSGGVAFGVLDAPGSAHNQAIVDNLTAHGPCGAGTPTEGGLNGAIKGCQDFEAANPDIECYAVLITDGEPSMCADPNGLATVAGNAAAAGVPTFTVGMPGANFAQMDLIAQAAGTDCNGAAPGNTCNASNAAEFAAALAAIRETVTEVIEMEVQHEVETTVPLDCEWEMPKSQTGETVDLNQVNVNLTDVGTGALTKLGKVGSVAECPNFQNGWYYDNPEAPTKLLACDDVCGVIKSIEAKIDILVGCESEVAVPR